MPKKKSLLPNFLFLARFLSIAALLLVSIPYTPQTTAQEESILITEIAAFESTDHEWIEIYNPTNQTISLENWKFVEGFTDSKPNGINHSITAFRGDFLIEPQKYAIIAQNADNFILDYPDLPDSLTIFDSAWSTLSEQGEQIALKDSENNTIEQFTYLACPNSSLALVSNTWQESTSPTPGYPNLQPSSETTDNSSQTTESQTPNTTSPAPDSLISYLTINELLPNPTGDDELEYIELYNDSKNLSFDLGGLILTDSSNKQFIIPQNTIINPLSFSTFYKTQTKISLNNTGGDSVYLYRDKQLIDSVSYTEDAEDGYSYSRKNSLWSWSTTPTPNSGNTISTPPQPDDNNETIEQSNNIPKLLTTSYKLLITEIFPNPEGSDTLEWLELFNLSNQSVDLVGCKLQDNSTRKFTIKNSLIIEAKKYLILVRELTGIALNNSGGDSVKLYDPNDNLIDQVSYSDKAEENLSYALFDQTWLWTEQPTPEDENILIQINQPPVADFEIIDNTLFDASESYDPDGDALLFSWKFDNNPTTTPTTTPIISHNFTTPGKYTIRLTTTDQKTSTIESKDITVGNNTAIEQSNSVILISEFFPNPDGPDESLEWVELYNPNTTTVDLINWSLDDSEGGSKPYLFKESTTIKPLSYLLLPRIQTKLALNNDYDSVRLYNPENKIVDEINYDDVLENFSYAIKDIKATTTTLNWFWTETPTPGQANKINLLKISLNTSTTSNKNYKPILTIDLSQVHEQTLDSRIKTTGFVSVEPGTLGKNIFYIYSPDLTSGIQIYSYYKDFPDLAIGDQIEVNGTLSQVQGEERLKISSANDIKILSNPNATSTIEVLQPLAINIEDITDQTTGSLISITGEVIENKNSYLTIDDGTEELKIYFKQSTNLSTKNLEPGDKVSVTGILSETNSGFRLLPRSSQDIKIQKVLGENDINNSNDSATVTINSSRQSQTLIKYLLVTLIALLIVLIGLTLKNKKRP